MVFKFAYFVKCRIDYQLVKSQCCRLAFVKLTIGYQPGKFQISQASGSNFREVSVRNKDTIMTSL